MPADIEHVDPAPGAVPTEAGEKSAGDEEGAGGEPQPRSPLVAAVLGNGAAFPFDLAALKTGHEHWFLKDNEKALMSEAAEAVACKHGVQLSPKTSPWTCLMLGFLGFGFPRLVEEIRLLRAEMKKNAPAEPPK